MSSNTPIYRLRTRPIKREDAGGLPPAPPADEAAAEQQDLGHDQSATPSPETPVDEPAPYRVGYKKPPLHTRFPKGVCPNPKGRPKGAKNVRTRIQELANEKVKVRENGKVRLLSKVEIGAIKALNKLAATGDLKSLDFILKLLGSSNDNRDGNGDNHVFGFDKDKINIDLLDWYIEQHRPKTGSDGERT